MRSRSPHALVAFTALVAPFALAAIACKEAPPPALQGAPPVAGPTSAASTTGATSTTSAASSASSSAAASPPVLPPSPLHVAAYRPGIVAVGTFDDGAVFATAESALAIARDGGELGLDVRNAVGISSIAGAWRHLELSFGGRFPENAWVTDNWMGYARGTPGFSVFHWEKKQWSSVANVEGPVAWFYAGFAPWKDGADLALRLTALPIGASPDMPELAKLLAKTPPGFEVPGKKVAGVPVFAKGARPLAFAALRTGEVLAAVDTGPSDASQTKVQRWAAGDAKGVLENLPGFASSFDDVFVTTSSPTSAWIGGDLDKRLYFAHFDGKAWAKIDAPAKGDDVASMAESADGTLWVVLQTRVSGHADTGELWKRPAATGVFERVVLPAALFPDLGVDRLVLASGFASSWSPMAADPKAASTPWRLEPRQVVVAPDGEPFVVAEVDGGTFGEDAGRWVVLRTKPVSSPLELPTATLLQAELDDLGDGTLPTATKASQKCTSVLVTAGDVPDGALADYDPASLRDAVKDLPGSPSPVSAFEVKMHGKRRLAFHAPSCDAACGKWLDALVATLVKKLPAAKPKVYCRVPLATRALAIKVPTQPEKK